VGRCCAERAWHGGRLRQRIARQLELAIAGRAPVSRRAAAGEIDYSIEGELADTAGENAPRLSQARADGLEVASEALDGGEP